jgi:hypothetical protein
MERNFIEYFTGLQRNFGFADLTKNIKDYKNIYKKEFLDGYENE